MITIIDYGLGNILAFANVYKRLNIPVRIAKTASDLEGASKLILPGVGAFDVAMQRLNQSGMRQSVDDLVLQQGVTVLGICVGMQILAHSSEEGKLTGLGWIDGRVKKFDVKAIPHRTHLPHMGWNNVVPVTSNPLFSGLDTDSRFYFLHSYYFECDHQDAVLAESDYGMKFSCAVNQRNIYGVQFHPEKSHRFGVQLLKNFADL
jgi:imidazole glycerol-phosphate synthase subunit HisH